MTEDAAKSLLYEYAITPDVFDASYIASDRRLEVILIELLKGICDNGMIANLNGGTWDGVIRSKLEGEVSGFGERMKTLMNRLSDLHRLVCYPEVSALCSDQESAIWWLKLAASSKFDGIIASHDVIERSGEQNTNFENALDVLDSKTWNQRRRTLTLETSDAYYRPVLEPVLRHARSLTIVDPYFSPHEPRFLTFLKLCIEKMGQRRDGNILPGRIIIHAGPPKSRDGNPPDTTEQRKDAWKRQLISITKNSNHEFRVYLRNRKLDGARFHDRYILTDQCCIAIPLGTDTDNDATNTTTTWCLLDQEDMRLKHDEISPETRTFRVLGGIKKHKNGKIENIAEMQ